MRFPWRYLFVVAAGLVGVMTAAGPAAADDPSLSLIAFPTVNTDEVYVGTTIGASVEVSIARGGTVVYTDGPVEATADTLIPSAQALFAFWDEFDLQPGDEVTLHATYGSMSATVSHVVRDIAVTDIDVTNDAVSGTADPNTQVTVWIHGTDQFVPVPVDGSGTWSISYAGDYDITPETGGSVTQFEANTPGLGTQFIWGYGEGAGIMDRWWLAVVAVAVVLVLAVAGWVIVRRRRHA